MPKWLRYALLTVLWWGVFGFLSKIGSAKASPAQMQILFTVGMLPLLAAALLRGKIDRDRLGATYGVLIGVLAGLGGIAYFAAMQTGKASLVGPVTSLFPLLTVLLAVSILKERMNRIQLAGVLLGLISIAILSV
jgi:transporter family protein